MESGGGPHTTSGHGHGLLSMDTEEAEEEATINWLLLLGFNLNIGQAGTKTIDQQLCTSVGIPGPLALDQYKHGISLDCL